MRPAFKKIILSLLMLEARLAVARYKPHIIAVTGSVGKTSTKDAIYEVVAEGAYVRKSQKSFNSEIGLPLTILGRPNAWNNPFKWILNLLDGLLLIATGSRYPEWLVLEVGADRPGDLRKILRIATPDAVIVTRLPAVPVHVEAYTNPAAVREEEFAPAYALAPGAPLIISADDPYALALSAPLQVQILTYGFQESANVCITEPELYEEAGKPVGMCATLHVGHAQKKVVVRGALGEQQLLPAAAAVAAGIALGLSLSEAASGLAGYEPPPGRTRLLEGKEGSVLIDDSYNASPAAVEEGLKALNLLRAQRRIAVLADMLELGRYSVAEHERVGTLAGGSADIVVAVGIRARAFASAARSARGGREDGVLAFDTAREAAAPLRALLQPGDAVLIKGSQSMRRERLVEALLADPLDAAKLVRQDKEWKRKL